MKALAGGHGGIFGRFWARLWGLDCVLELRPDEAGRVRASFEADGEALEVALGEGGADGELRGAIRAPDLEETFATFRAHPDEDGLLLDVEVMTEGEAGQVERVLFARLAQDGAFPSSFPLASRVCAHDDLATRPEAIRTSNPRGEGARPRRAACLRPTPGPPTGTPSSTRFLEIKNPRPARRSHPATPGSSPKGGCVPDSRQATVRPTKTFTSKGKTMKKRLSAVLGLVIFVALGVAQAMPILQEYHCPNGQHIIGTTWQGLPICSY